MKVEEGLYSRVLYPKAFPDIFKIVKLHLHVAPVQAQFITHTADSPGFNGLGLLGLSRAGTNLMAGA